MRHKNKKVLEYKKELVQIFAQVKGNKELSEFLVDILTPNELETLAFRWQIVKRLNKGETHRQIADDLGIGISTVNRGARELRNKNGGFHIMLQKISK